MWRWSLSADIAFSCFTAFFNLSSNRNTSRRWGTAVATTTNPIARQNNIIARRLAPLTTWMRASSRLTLSPWSDFNAILSQQAKHQSP
jgi:hypothetical protein